VREDGGVYCWTLGGEFLKDADGNKIPVTGPQGPSGPQGPPGATGVSPTLRINATTNFWEICTNGTCNDDGDWTNVLNSAGSPVKATGDDGEKGDQGDAIFATGGIDNSHDEYVEFTLADGSPLQVPKYVKLSITFTPPPTPFDNGEPKDILLTLAGYVRSIVAVDVPRGWTIAFDLETKGSEKIKVTAPAANNGYYTAAGTATLLVSDSNTQTITAPLALECTPYQAPEKLGIDFTQPETFLKGDEKKVEFTTQGNAAAVNVLDVPTGWTVAVTKQDNAGTFTITAKECGGDGKAFVFVSDDAGNTVMRTLELVYTPATVTLPAVLNGGDRTLAVINAEMTAVEYTTSVGILGAALIGAPAGVSGSYSGDTYTMYGMPTEAGTFTYTVTLNIEEGGHCAIATTGVLEVENCTDCAVWAGYCGGIKYVSNVQSEGQMKWSTAASTCEAKGDEGWRLPTDTELKCMCGAKGTLPKGYVSDWYWNSTYTGSKYCIVRFSDCNANAGGNGDDDYYYYVKCVK
jgi:hypothetical protein